MGHLLPGRERFLHQHDAVCHIVPQAVIFPRVDADHKAGVQRGDAHQLLDHRPELQNVVDLLAQDVTAGHIGVSGDGLQHLEVFRQVIPGGHRILDDGKRHPADPGQEADQDAGLPIDGGHHRVDLPQHLHGLFFLYQGGVGDLHILNAAFGVGARDPEKLILE